MVRLSTVGSVIGGYASMAIVANADNVMAKTLQEINIGGEMSAIPLYFEKMTNMYDDWEQIKEWRTREMTCLKRIFLTINLVIYRCVRFFYICVYYYFTPFLTPIVVTLGAMPQKMED